MRDPVTRCHHVHTARTQHRLVAQAIVMNNLAIMKPGDRLQADVRVGSHVHGFSLVERQWAEPVQKAPWSNKAAVLHRKRSRDRQRSEAQCPVRIPFKLRWLAPSAMHSSAGTVSERFDMPAHSSRAHEHASASHVDRPLIDRRRSVAQDAALFYK